MRHLLLFAHLLGFVLWLGGGLAAMNLGIAMRSAPRGDLAVMTGIQARLHRGLILPGSLLTVVTGLLLTLQLYGSAVSVAGFPPALMVMEGAGLLAAALTLAVGLPTVTRLSRLDPVGEHGPLFDSLRNRAAISGAVMGVLGMTALVCGALLR